MDGKSRDLLEKALKAFNMIPNIRLSFGSTYAIAEEVQKHLEAPATAPDWKGFSLAIMEEWQEHGDIEASTKFELAVKHRILREIPGGYDPEQHEDIHCCAELGDPWFELNT